jgi:Mlc titration factor MtfA (ptsG expression regulator)
LRVDRSSETCRAEPDRDEMFRALRDWKRQRVLRQARIDDARWRAVALRLEFVRSLPRADLDRLRDLVVLFLAEKQFASAVGLELTDEMRFAIATQACMLILNLDLDFYRGWKGIIVYPEQFVPRHQHVDEAGVVHQGDEPYSGEAWLGGPVILSWADVQYSGYPDGVNVVIHEFAHKLDMLNGDANGFPPLHAGMQREAWAKSMTTAYRDFCARVDGGEDTIIDPYAAQSPGEFFAVMSEAFFELPDVVKDEYPAVYDQFRQFYRQDPAVRLSEPAGVHFA